MHIHFSSQSSDLPDQNSVSPQVSWIEEKPQVEAGWDHFIFQGNQTICSARRMPNAMYTLLWKVHIYNPRH